MKAAVLLLALGALAAAQDLSLTVTCDGNTFAAFGGVTTTTVSEGSNFVVQGWIYQDGSSVGATNGILADGTAEFPAEVVGNWYCRGWFLFADNQVFVATEQLFDLNAGPWLSTVAGEHTIVSEGLEAGDDSVFWRAVIGGSGAFAGVAGSNTHQTIGTNPTTLFNFDVNFWFGNREAGSNNNDLDFGAYRVSCDGNKFIYTGPLDSSAPTYGGTFKVQGWIYPNDGTCTSTNCILADGTAEFPEAVEGTWYCRGWVLESFASVTTGAFVLTQQVFDWDVSAGAAGQVLMVSDGVELTDLLVWWSRTLSGGTGPAAGVVGEAAQCALAANPTGAPNFEFGFTLAPVRWQGSVDYWP